MIMLAGNRIDGVMLRVDGEWREVELPRDCTGFDIHVEVSNAVTAEYRCYATVAAQAEKGKKG